MINGYSETIRKWAANDSHTGILNNPDGIGEVGLEAGEIGRKLAVRFTMQQQGDTINKVRYQVFGCGFTIAACAAAADLAEGKLLENVRTIDAQMINKSLEGLPSEREYCADLAAKALQAAVSSLENKGELVESGHQEEEHGPRISDQDSVYRLLMSSKKTQGIIEEDRRLFAGVIALGAAEPCFLTKAIGLENQELDELLSKYFPAICRGNLLYLSAHATTLPPEINRDVRKILQNHIPLNSTGETNETSRWLANILAARAAQPGHLWIAMGLFERPELTAAIKRHLPSLAKANNQGMRWKRYLFKQACEMNGGVLCKSPSCGDCSDYALCFVEN